MFEATLRNRSQPELGSLTILFPIPEERYENVILALQNLQIGDVRKQDCCMHRDYIKEHNPIRFNDLCLSGELWTYLADLNEQAQR